MEIKNKLNEFYVHETTFTEFEQNNEHETFKIVLKYNEWQIDETKISGITIVFGGVKKNLQKAAKLYGEEVLDIDLNAKSNDVKIIFDNDNVDILEFKATSVEVFKNN